MGALARAGSEQPQARETLISGQAVAHLQYPIPWVEGFVPGRQSDG